PAAAVRRPLPNAGAPDLAPVTRQARLAPGGGAPADVELVDLFFNHPLIQTLRLQADLERTWLSRRLDGLVGRLGRALGALFGSAGEAPPPHPELAPQTRLTFIPAPVFVQALFEVLKPAGWSENEPLTFASFWRMVNQLPDDRAGPLKLVLKSLANDPTQDLEAVRRNLARWFDTGMEQASTWYRR